LIAQNWYTPEKESKMPDSSPVGLLSLTKFDHVKHGIKDKQKKNSHSVLCRTKPCFSDKWPI